MRGIVARRAALAADGLVVQDLVDGRDDPLAEPSMACATGLDGLRSWAAICAADRPASTCGSYCAPARTYRLPMSRNGTAPDWSALLT